MESEVGLILVDIDDVRDVPEPRSGHELAGGDDVGATGHPDLITGPDQPRFEALQASARPAGGRADQMSKRRFEIVRVVRHRPARRELAKARAGDRSVGDDPTAPLGRGKVFGQLGQLRG